MDKEQQQFLVLFSRAHASEWRRLKNKFVQVNNRGHSVGGGRWWKSGCQRRSIEVQHGTAWLPHIVQRSMLLAA